MSLFEKSLTLIMVLSCYMGGLASSYIPHTELHPGQVRFSSKNVKLKIENALKQEEVLWNEEKGCYEGKYHGGKSLFPEAEALPVVRAPFGLVLADGHHHTLAAIQLGVGWLPVEEIADLSSLSPSDFWEQAEERGWVFPYDLEGHRVIPPKTFTSLIDDPNRYFAAITARKCQADGDLATSVGAAFPLWIKVGKDIPFIEFTLSDALRSGGVEYTYEMGDQPPVDFVEEARRVLVEAHIPGLRVVPERKHYTEIMLNDPAALR